MLLICSVVLFSSTFLEGRDSEIVPFTTATGYTGTVTLDLPRRVFTGDDAGLSARVSISAPTSGNPPTALVGRLEAGTEALSPVGRVTVNLQSGADVELVWKLRTASALVYPGNLWLWLLSESGEDLLLVREFALDSRSYLGMGIIAVRITALSLAVIALLMAGFILIRSSSEKVT